MFIPIHVIMNNDRIYAMAAAGREVSYLLLGSEDE
jgi:hypothetical protein